MIKRIVGWFVLLPLSVALILFALANRHPVVVGFNPFTTADAPPEAGYGVPLFLVIYAVLLVGVLLGGVATWFTQSRHRLEKRQLRREAERLHRDLDLARRPPAETQGGFGDPELLTR